VELEIIMETPLRVTMRAYNKNVQLSTIGFGGMLLVGREQEAANLLVAESFEWGINYFDVAPSYGDGEAEVMLGIALEPFRPRVFLACKTMARGAVEARRELEQSLERLRTGYLDLYQFHAVTSIDEVDRIFSPAGAGEAFVEAREQGLIRYIGFSAHSVEAALALLDRFRFDSMMFPVNLVCYGQGNFGPQVVEKARKSGVARIGLKALADGKRQADDAHKYPNCWYRPIVDLTRARDALRFALSEDVTAVLPPGDERLFRLAVELAADFVPLSQGERQALLASTDGRRPLFRA
jgi:aryl-alcohol dehydrogenase-like predicted oxidoreductase